MDGECPYSGAYTSSRVYGTVRVPRAALPGARDAALVRSWYGSYAFWGGTFRFLQRATDIKINSQHDRRMAHDIST